MAKIASLPVKILAQAPGSEPVEIGVYEVPIHVQLVKKEGQVQSAQVNITADEIDMAKMFNQFARNPLNHL